MSWILAVYLISANGQVESLANEYTTEKECVAELHNKIKAMEAHNENIESASCTPGIVISAIDD